MNVPPEDEAIRGCARTLRIIHFALAGGIVLFAGVTLWLRSRGEAAPPHEGTPIVTWVALGVAAVGVALSFVVPQRVAARARSLEVQHRSGNWAMDPRLAILSASSIVGAALLEGPGFLGLVAWMLEGQVAAFVLGVLMAGGILLRMPTEDRIRERVRELG